MNRFRILRRIRRETKGATAVEFALIAAPFFTFIWAIFETGLLFFAQQTLTHGVQMTSRQIRTGQVHSAQLNQTQFRNLVCAQVNYLLSCDPDKLYIDVEAYEHFSDVGQWTSPIDPEDGTLDVTNMGRWNIGESGNISGGTSIVIVTAYYVWPLFTPVISGFYSNMAGNKRLVSASVVFKNEPF